MQLRSPPALALAGSSDREFPCCLGISAQSRTGVCACVCVCVSVFMHILLQINDILWPKIKNMSMCFQREGKCFQPGEHLAGSEGR